MFLVMKCEMRCRFLTVTNINQEKKQFLTTTACIKDQKLMTDSVYNNPSWCSGVACGACERCKADKRFQAMVVLHDALESLKTNSDVSVIYLYMELLQRGWDLVPRDKN
jgi:hypothetical protein